MKIRDPIEFIKNGAAGDYCFVIAEAGSNHNGDLSMAKKLIETAAECKADAVKFQFFKAESIAAKTSHPIARMEDGKTLFEFYKQYETPREWIPILADHCRTHNIIFFATPFDHESVDLLESVGCEIYKVASFEIVDLPLLKKIAKTGKPIILSTGMADEEDIQDAIETIYQEGNKNIIILHCGINYPVAFVDVNLRAMKTIGHKFSVPVGYSDHTPGITVPVAAVARGAKVIEKHFTLSRSMDGPDHGFAIEPEELKAMVTGIRACCLSLGSPVKRRTESEELHYRRGRRSLFAAKDIPRGKVLEMADFAVLRPGVGLKPKYIYDLVGKAALKFYRKHDPIDWSLVQ